jgi:hypothetical protein
VRNFCVWETGDASSPVTKAAQDCEDDAVKLTQFTLQHGLGEAVERAKVRQVRHSLGSAGEKFKTQNFPRHFSSLFFFLSRVLRRGGKSWKTLFSFKFFSAVRLIHVKVAPADGENSAPGISFADVVDIRLVPLEVFLAMRHELASAENIKLASWREINRATYKSQMCSDSVLWTLVM